MSRNRRRQPTATWRVLPPHFELQTERLALGGEAVAHIDGKVVFVGGALPDERVKVALTTEKKRFAKADVSEVLDASPLRIDDDCHHSRRDGCGGCGLRFVSAADALPLKAGAVMGELRKLAPSLTWPEPRLCPTTEASECRVRMRLHIDKHGNLGLFKQASHQVVEVPDCLVATSPLRQAAARLRAFVKRFQSQRPESLTLETDLDGGVRLYWPAATPISQLREVVRQGIVLGVRSDTGEAGDPWLRQTVELGARAIQYHRRVGTFGQANPVGNGILRQWVHSTLDTLQPSRVVDHFAGSGNFSLIAALHCSDVVAVEVDPVALESLEVSAAASGLGDRITRVVADLSTDDLGSLPTGDTLILDPPRSGARALCTAVATHPDKPAHLLYISCGPATFARDIAALSEHYAVAELLVVDMFPGTPHVELACHLVKRG